MENNLDVNAEKLAAAEAELSALKAANEAMIAEKATLMAPLKAELTKTLAEAPEAVRNYFAGKELDPVKDVVTVKAEIDKYKQMEVDAQNKAKADIDAYRAGLKAKYGTNLPSMDKVLVDQKVQEKKPEDKNVVPANQNGSEKAVLFTDLVGKPSLNDQELRSITGRISSMSAYLNARKQVAITAKD